MCICAYHSSAPNASQRDTLPMQSVAAVGSCYLAAAALRGASGHGACVVGVVQLVGSLVVDGDTCAGHTA